MGSTDYTSYLFFFPPWDGGTDTVQNISSVDSCILISQSHYCPLFCHDCGQRIAKFECGIWRAGKTLCCDSFEVFFLICHLFCKAVLASIIQESLWTRSVGAVTPCRENLSPRRNAELLLILKQMMCTEQRPSWEACIFQLVRESPDFTESDYLLQFSQEFATFPYPESH